ncbi:MAG: PadR family transcriptional regulator [Chloroflexota bacterium]
MPLEHAILGFLGFQAMTGYDLKKNFDRSVANFWSATQSHIYKALDGLEKKGWAESRLIPQEGKPNRKEYQITGPGRSELRRWLTTPLPLPQVREGWLIQLFFSHESSNEEIASLLQSRKEAIQSELKTLRECVSTPKDSESDGLARARRLWRLTLDYGIAYYEAELAWLDQAIEQVQSLS